jgi:uncharacterized protein YjdB
MFKTRKKLIAKILLLATCTSIMPTTLAFAEETGGTQSTGTTVVQTTGSSVSVNDESSDKTKSSVVDVTTDSAVSVTDTSEFGFDSATGTIRWYTGSDSELVIPSEINGVKVTRIGNSAFSQCTGLTSVEIPDSVTSIGDGAFDFCTRLTSVEIPDSVTSISTDAFFYCTGLTSVTIPDSVTRIDDRAFWGCTGLTSVTIPDSVTSIGESAFWGCTGLTSITIPDSVTSIGWYGLFCIDATFYVESENTKQLLISSGVDKSKIILNGQSSTVSVTSVKLNNTSLSLEKGNTGTLTATVLPDNATNNAVTWASSNINVATVDENGKVTGVSAGNATITCTASDGSGQSATCLVTVTEKSTVKVSSIKLSVKNGGDQTFTLVPAISPSNATNKTLTWTSSNTKVAIVDNNGNVTYVGKGNATITCTATDGSNVSKSFYVQNDYYTSQTK